LRALARTSPSGRRDRRDSEHRLVNPSEISAARLGALAADFRLDPILLPTNRSLTILALMRTARTTDFRSVAVPRIMYGTAWKEDRTQALTLEAIATGFRAFDTANQRKHYVEEGVGAAVTAAIASGIVKREDLFLQTKFTYQRGQDHRLPYNPACNLTTQVRQSIASSLEHLGVTRIDSYILHGPSQLSGLSEADWETWRAMEDAADEGWVGLLGVSNVAVDQVKALLCGARIRPPFVQNRCFVRASWDRDMYALCQKENILYQAFALLSGNRQALVKPCVTEIAHHHNKTVPQVIYRFAFELGMVPLTGTTDVSHMREALDIFDFTLTHNEIETLLTLHGHH